MEISSKHQLIVFMIYIASGMACGAFFDMQRSLRKMFSAGKIRTFFEDLFFAVVCTAGAIIAGYFFNKGEMRYYQVLGLISGVLFYAAFLSELVMRVLANVYRFIGVFLIKPVVRIIKIMLLPFLKIVRISRRIFDKIKHCFTDAVRRIKRCKNKLKKRMKML